MKIRSGPFSFGAAAPDCALMPRRVRQSTGFLLKYAAVFPRIVEIIWHA
jgi:hypothetical protein